LDTGEEVVNFAVQLLKNLETVHLRAVVIPELVLVATCTARHVVAIICATGDNGSQLA
jgi:hypothetical protein